MTVTAIESVTRHKMRVSLDGEPAFVFTDREIREWNLTEEMEFDRAEEEALVQYVCREAARTAMNLLVKRDYAQAELYRKLRERGYSEYFARQGIAYVSSYHYLDDERYARQMIVSQFTFSHQVFGEGFYLVDVCVKRLSESEDIIPVMISERLVDVTQDYEGEYILVTGQFRSYNRHEEKKNRLVLSVFAREITFVEEEDDSVKSNQIYLDGYICKPPVYRKTPLGREIADLLIAVNRPYGKSDYIPCICWGRNARYASAFAVGGHVLVWGRIQSREYMKRLNETESEKRVAYEVSVSKLEYVEQG